MQLPRNVKPLTNPAGILAALAAIYAAAIAIYNAVKGREVADAQVITAGLAAVGYLITRFVVTPLADPKDSAGTPLVPAEPVTAGRPLTGINLPPAREGN